MDVLERHSYNSGSLRIFIRQRRLGKSVTIWPGRNGSTTPYGSAYAKVMHTSTAWTNSSNANYDYGLLELNKNIGTSTGYFGMHWTSSSLNGKALP